MKGAAVQAIQPQPRQGRKRVIDLPPPFSPKRIDDIAKCILSAPDIGAARIVERPRAPGKRPSTIFFFARADDIRAILADDETFTLHPYDAALGAAAGDVRFILGAKSKTQHHRRAMVKAAIGDWGSKPFETVTESVRTAARQAAAEFTAHLRCRPPGPVAFNVIRDYGYLIPYLTVSRVVGVSGPDHPSPLVRAFVFFRNLRARHRLLLTPEQARCQTVVTWAHLIFGHIFTNFENRNGALLFLARTASREFNEHIERLIVQHAPGFETTLLSEFLNRRNQFKRIPNETYRMYVRSILFEFTGAMMLLVGISFGRILNTLISRAGSWPGFLANLHAEDGERLINEALRLNPTTSFLFRYVDKRAEIADVEMHPGDHVCVLIGACGKAEGGFRSSPPPNDAFLNFGLQGGPHAYYGQQWARIILQEMLAALADVERLRPAEGVTLVHEFQGLPDELEMVLTPPSAPP